MGESDLGQLGTIAIVSLWLIVIVLLCEFVGTRMCRYSTRAVPPRQGVSCVSCLHAATVTNVSCLRHARTAGQQQPVAGNRAQ